MAGSRWKLVDVLYLKGNLFFFFYAETCAFNFCLLVNICMYVLLVIFNIFILDVTVIREFISLAGIKRFM